MKESPEQFDFSKEKQGEVSEKKESMERMPEYSFKIEKDDRNFKTIHPDQHRLRKTYAMGELIIGVYDKNNERQDEIKIDAKESIEDIRQQKIIKYAMGLKDMKIFR